KLYCTSNQGLRLGNGIPFSTALKSGIHGLSNGHLDAPWPKTRLLREGLHAAIQDAQGSEQKGSGPIGFENRLFDLLSHTGLADDAELPNTGVPYEWEKMLSAVKIISPHYGTRSSAVLLMDKTGVVRFSEVSFNPEGEETRRQVFEIPLTPAW
ncbi:MAG TPA: NRDE family protein, partial [Limnobacter sp.]|nr:NRDE family protein [Limnobacter sp.]